MSKNETDRFYLYLINLLIMITKKLLILLITFSCSVSFYSQDVKYFDESGTLISERKFKKQLLSLDYFAVPHDSIPHKILTPRLVKGKIEKREILLDLLEKAIGQSIDREVPTVIIYYPGLDQCNKGGINTAHWLKSAHLELSKGLKKKANTQPIYIYKEYTGLEKYRGIVTWYKDPYQVIEQKFFKYHYPCGSFVVLGTDGCYISYKGEYATGQIIDAAKTLYEK